MNASKTSVVEIYRDGTKKLIDMIKAGQLEIFEKDGHLWVRGNDQERQLPSKEDFARDAFLSGNQVTENLKDIAKEVGVSESALYKIIHEEYPQSSTKEVCLCAMLRQQNIPSLEEVNRTLMKNQRPLLYTETISRSSNCRDYLMIRIFELAREAVRPEDGWVLFANRAILYFNSRLGSREDIAMLPLFKREKGDLEKEFRLFLRQAQSAGAPLGQWEQGIVETAKQSAPQYRKQVMERYCAREKIPTRTQASLILSRKVHLSDDYIRKMFGGWGRTGCRDSLIACGEAMGCTYGEINLMLREVDAAILYPNSGASGDVLIMERLLKNEEIYTEKTV